MLPLQEGAEFVGTMTIAQERLQTILDTFGHRMHPEVKAAIQEVSTRMRNSVVEFTPIFEGAPQYDAVSPLHGAFVPIPNPAHGDDLSTTGNPASDAPAPDPANDALVPDDGHDGDGASSS